LHDYGSSRSLLNHGIQHFHYKFLICPWQLTDLLDSYRGGYGRHSEYNLDEAIPYLLGIATPHIRDFMLLHPAYLHHLPTDGKAP